MFELFQVNILLNLYQKKKKKKYLDFDEKKIKNVMKYICTSKQLDSVYIVDVKSI